MLKTNGYDLRELDALRLKGRLKVAIDSRYPPASLASALQRSMSGQSIGKIVIDMHT